MDQVDRYVLGLAVLEGDRDARKILADLLEEQGDRGLADWARKSGGKDRERLDVAIMLMPHRDAMRLGCEFAAESTKHMTHEATVVILPVTNIVYQWLKGEVQDEVFLHKLPQLFQATEQRRGSTDGWLIHAPRVCCALIDGSKNAIQAEQSRNSGNMRLALHFEKMTRQSVRCVTRASSFHSSRIPWHVKRGIDVFRHLISPEEHPWPK
jgi:hypothetical protein